ncbi:MAG TPA: hypothetical protein VK171_11725, partial [Fimbriimonas sp.]|nr:hypothetical protein [Fimbriimonas sp.]
CVAQALHWFQYDAFFNEVRRVSKPGAIFAAIGYGWFQVDDHFDRELSERVLVPIEPYWAPENRVLWNEYRDVPFPFEKIEAPALSIEMRWSFSELMSYLRTWSAVRLFQADAKRDVLNDTAPELVQAWGSDPEETRSVTMPVFVLAGRVE